MIIIYLGDYYLLEEEQIKKYIPCVRIKQPFLSNANLDIHKNDIALIRGGKLKNNEYSELVCYLNKNKINCIVNENDYEKIGNAVEYSKCFGKYAPKILMFNIDDDLLNISNSISSSELTFPLFVRSDVESAAKYVGFDSCVLKSADKENLESVILPIKKYITNPSKIIMKEIVNITKHNAQNIEYRAIVISNKIICFDYNQDTNIPAPSSLDCYYQFQDCINLAYMNGLHGAYFVDFGINSTGNIFVIECKNLINGTIKNIDVFINGIKNYRIETLSNINK